MLRLALKSVKHNPLRLLLTAIAVMLSVMLVASTLTLTSAFQRGFDSLFGDIYGSTDVLIEPDPAAQIDQEDDQFAAQEGMFTDDDLAAVAAVDGVEGVYGGVQVNGTVLDKDKNPQQSPFGAGGAPSQIFNWTGNPDDASTTLVEGHGVEADNQILLDIDAAPALHYELGDQVRVATENGITTYELVGLVRFGEDNSLQGATLAFISTATAKELNGSDTYNSASVVAADGVDHKELATRIQEVLPEDTRAITGQDKADESAAQFGDIVKWVDIFTIAFALIALFVGAYLIVNTFRIIVTQRTRELGLLRAIGVTGHQVRTMILLEALVVAVVAATVGVLSGYLVALGLAAVVETFSGNIFGSVLLPLDAVLGGYAMAISVTVVAALLPAIHASRISPMAALRDAATEQRKPLGLRNIVGGAMTAAAVAGIVIGLQGDVPRPYIWVGAGAVVLILGVTLLAAQVLVPLAYGLKAALTSMFGVTGKLAANNIKREPRRSANTAAALMIGVMLLSLVATFTQSVKAVITSQFQQLEADFFVMSGQGAVPQGALDIIASQDGVEVVSRTALSTALVDGESYSLGVIDADSADRAFDYNNDPDFTGLDGGVFIDPTLVEAGYEVGDTITVKGDNATLDLEITGKYLSEGDANLWVDWGTGEELAGKLDVVQAMVIASGTDPDLSALQTQILDALAADFPLVGLQQPDQFQQLANMLVDIVLGIISALLGAALIVAILGVANTLLLSVTERTREVGLLRAVGLNRGAVASMVVIESIVMSIFGTIMGMILGVSLGAALVDSLNEFGFTEIAVPWLWLIVYTIGALFAGLVAAVWPAIKAARMDILKSIAADG